MPSESATEVSRRELINRIPLVRYVPAREIMSESPHKNTFIHAFSSYIYRRGITQWEESDLPDVYLESNRAGCHICLINFEEPRRLSPGSVSTKHTTNLPALEELGDGIECGQQLAPEPLRNLPCGHVFHRSCVDEWLLQESGQCPLCRKLITDASTSPASSGRNPKTWLRRVFRLKDR